MSPQTRMTTQRGTRSRHLSKTSSIPRTLASTVSPASGERRTRHENQVKIAVAHFFSRRQATLDLQEHHLHRKQAGVALVSRGQGRRYQQVVVRSYLVNRQRGR